MTYVVISLVASTLFVTALALDLLGHRHGEHGRPRRAAWASCRPALRSAFAVLLLVVFGIKAALFPLFFWLPDSYPTAPSPVTAVFAGLLTKVGVYAIIRTQTLLFPDDARPATLILVVAGLTMVVGVLGAIAQDDVKRILSFNIVSHIGFMVMGLGLLHRRRPGRGGLLHGPPHRGEDLAVPHRRPHRARRRLEPPQPPRRDGADRARRRRAVPRAGAVSLAGIPPLSGFVAKLALVEAGFDGHALRDRGRGIAREPAHPVLDDEDLVGRVLEPRRPSGPRAAPHAVGRLGGPVLMVVPTVAAGRRSGSPSPSPPGRSTRSASAPRPTCSTRPSTSATVLGP